MTATTFWDFVRRFDDWRNVKAIANFIFNRRPLLDKVLANPAWTRADTDVTYGLFLILFTNVSVLFLLGIYVQRPRYP